MATSLTDSLQEIIKQNKLYVFDYNEFTDFKKIGVGGFGEVQKAYWTTRGYTVALKSLRVDIILDEKDENDIKEFIREVQQLEDEVNNNDTPQLSSGSSSRNTEPGSNEVKFIPEIVKPLTESFKPQDDIPFASNIIKIEHFTLISSWINQTKSYKSKYTTHGSVSDENQ
ncbi:5579_t:CDS:2 [Cetraspora pellucida]|uniref:5579_t:CDS:1 n=1 Tax=Cetraspora pellucida TaxID=1433469 RepID=A0A9N8VKB0_9GLOM|nr:5579_t:CDS:2 [Cetraspora pellucida]